MEARRALTGSGVFFAKKGFLRLHKSGTQPPNQAEAAKSDVRCKDRPKGRELCRATFATDTSQIVSQEFGALPTNHEPQPKTAPTAAESLERRATPPEPPGKTALTQGMKKRHLPLT